MKKITAREFDARFDRGEDVTEFLDISTIRHPDQTSTTKQRHTRKSRKPKQGHAERLNGAPVTTG